LVQVGLGPRWKEDEYIARYTCIALQKLAKKPTRKSKDDKAASMDDVYAHNRLKSNHPIFQKLSDLVKDNTITWYGATEQAINTIYVLSEKPDQICAAIIKDVAFSIFPQIQPNPPQVNTEHLECSVADLSKFFFVVGQVALKQLVHIEEIHSEIRKRRSAQADKSAANQNQNPNQQAHPQSRQQGKKDQAKHKLTAIEEELGVVAAAEETEVELLQETAEKEIVGKNLLGTFGPIIALVAANAGGHFNDHTLRTSAVLALCKFMCVSSEFCDKHLQLLFTILQTAPESAIRSNIIIALGDLAFRFPNLIEPWTSNIYAMLRDTNNRVRKNALMVLTHLILNDMIKVKGQISEMALCIEDKDTRISDLARLFFQEFSRKGNAIYNILPDLIGSLSNTTSNSFKNIMKYLFSFIEKDKQAESLVEKLCHRLKTAADSSQARNLAYCLSLLNYNDKALKKLNEMSKSFTDKLGDDEIHQSFNAILNKAKKFAKADIKEILNELESKIQQTPDNAQDEQNDAENEAAEVEKEAKPRNTRAKAKQKQKAKKPKSKKSKRVTMHEEDEEDMDVEEEVEEVEEAAEYQSSSEDEEPPRVSKKVSKSSEDEDESGASDFESRNNVDAEDISEEEDIPVPTKSSKSKSTQKSTRGKRSRK